MKKTRLAAFIISLVLLLSGCSNSSTNKQIESSYASPNTVVQAPVSEKVQPDTQKNNEEAVKTFDIKQFTIEDTVRKLASDEFKGRLTGTEENKKVGELIAAIFKEIGLKEYKKGTYMFNYKQKPLSALRNPEETTELIEAQHVIGIIPGKQHSNAVVLTAHFDHLGFQNGKFRGAIDDSSGISVLLDLAKKLNNPEVRDKLPNDIVICAMNGEEEGISDAATLVKYIKSKYKNARNIDIDCLSGIYDDALRIAGDPAVSGELIDAMMGYLKGIGQKADLASGDCREGYRIYLQFRSAIVWSNDMAFARQGIPALSVGQNYLFDIIHTPEDTPDKIDFSFLEKVSNELFDFICKHGEELFK